MSDYDQRGPNQSDRAEFSNFVISTLKFVLVLAFFINFLAMIGVGGIIGWQLASEPYQVDGSRYYIEPDRSKQWFYAFLGACVGAIAGFISSVVMTGFGFLLLDIRRLLIERGR